MTDDEARAIIREGCGGWVGWDETTDAPYWSGNTVTLDGTFTVDELQAILHFAAPEAKP